MKKSINTFLKHPTKDNANRSANPPVIRASTILFDTMQELYTHEKKIKKHQKISHYSYGRYGSSTTIELENILKELEKAYHVFLTGTGFGGVALALMSLCRPGDEIVVSDNVYGPTKEISEKLLREFQVNAIFYNPDSFEDLKNKVSKIFSVSSKCTVQSTVSLSRSFSISLDSLVILDSVYLIAAALSPSTEPKFP